MAGDEKVQFVLTAKDRATATVKQLKSELGMMGGAAGKASGPLGKLSAVTGGLVSPMTLGIGAAAGLGAALVGTVQGASDLNEEMDKAKVVFGPAADEMIRFAEGASDIGLSTKAALGAAGAFGNMFNTVGLAQGESQDMSETMVQLAADMGSFNNIDPTEMLDKLRSGLSGEAEPLRQFGVLISEATVKDFAYRKGIAKTGKPLTEAQKVQARYGLILEQTAIQQGNYEDTSGSLANVQRSLAADMENLSDEIGRELLPVMVGSAKFVKDDFIPVMRDVIPVVTDVVGTIGDGVKEVSQAGATPGFRDMFQGALDSFEKVPPQISDTTRAAVAAWKEGDLVGTVATEMAEASDAITESPVVTDVQRKFRAAAEAARAEAVRIPGEVAAGILEGRDAVVIAAQGLADAATDPLLEQAKITEIRQQMKDIANVTQEEFEAATPATIAAEKAQLAGLEIELAGHLLRADPKNKEAAGLLSKYLKSNDPATKAAAEAMMSAVEQRAFIMKNDIEAKAEALGVSIPEAIRLHRKEATDAAAETARQTAQRLDRLSYDGAAAGKAFSRALATGMDAEAWRVYASAVSIAAGVRGIMPGSEPKDPNSPLRGITEGFGFGETLGKGILSGKGAVVNAMRSVSSAMVPLGGAMAGAPAPAPAYASAGGTEVHTHLYLDGREIAETVTRHQYYMKSAGASVLPRGT